MVQEGAIPKLQALLSSPRPDVAEQAVWALGNIAGDGPQTRDIVLSTGILQDLLKLIKPDVSVSMAVFLAAHWNLAMHLFLEILVEKYCMGHFKFMS